MQKFLLKHYEKRKPIHICIFNLHYSVVNEIAKKFFKTDQELVDKGFKETKIVEIITNKLTKPSNNLPYPIHEHTASTCV